jgi:hypothetical protein
MDAFLLATQRLNRSGQGQGETGYKYFKMFLVTLGGFPAVVASLVPYYAKPIPRRNAVEYDARITTIFAILDKIREYLVRAHPASPFSGAALSVPKGL